MKIARSHIQGVQNVLDKDPKFGRVFTMAKANGLPRDLHAAYLRCYENNGLYDMGIATLMLAGTQTWEEYLQECEEEIADMILGGRNPRIKELGLDMTKPFKPTARKPKEKVMPKETPKKTKSAEPVTAKEGDEFRRQSRLICDDAGWTLTETGGAILVEYPDGSELARAPYQRGTKNEAWKVIYENLEILS